MERETLPGALQYETPVPRDWKVLYKRLSIGTALTGLAAIVLGVLADTASFGPGVTLAGVLLGGSAGMYVALHVVVVVRVMRPVRKMTEYEFDREWLERKGKAEAVMEGAEREWADGPTGVWRSASVSYDREAPQVLEERELRFLEGGVGQYRWYRRGDERGVMQCEFDFRAEGPNVLAVRVRLPGAEEWLRAEYFMETRPVAGGGPAVWLLFAGENPLIEGLMEYWPFWGEFERDGVKRAGDL